ncbi:MAG: hypothetical protein FWE02_04225 [Defluviitaleaceae bacterium]|nr:hypothetical protein [Defluviitaleaceae bacterium]
MVNIVYKNKKIELMLTADTIYLLALLLEELVFSKNPITNGNDKLKKKLRKIIFEPSRAKIIEELCTYLNENKMIDMEAYALFRLTKYSHMIDSILYSLVRTNLQNFP